MINVPANAYLNAKANEVKGKILQLPLLLMLKK